MQSDFRSSFSERFHPRPLESADAIMRESRVLIGSHNLRRLQIKLDILQFIGMQTFERLQDNRTNVN